MAQAKASADGYLDPYEFLGIQTPQGQEVGQDFSSVPEYQDPETFLGIAPGTLMVPTQSARSGQAPKWGAVSQTISGTALGYGPELQGLESYLSQPSDSKITLSNQIFNARQEKAAFERRNPGLAQGLEIFGSIPTVLAANALTPGITAGMRSANPVARVGANWLAGAEAGVLQSKITGGTDDLVGNALLGGTINAVGVGASKAIGSLLKPTVLPGVADTVRSLEAMGVKLRPSQVAMKEAVRKADELMASGGNEQQLRDYTRAISRSFGENTDQLTAKVAGQAMQRIDAERSAIVGRTSVSLDAALNSELATVGASMKGAPSASQQQVREAIREIRKSFTNLKLDGETYRRLTEKGGIIHNLSSDNNATVSAAGRRFREAIDDAVERSSLPGTKEAWAENRAQMKNLLAIQPLVEGNVTGFINPQAVHSQVRKFFSDYGWGDPIYGGLDTLAEGGKLMPRLTATGDVVKREKQNWYTRPSAVLGMGAVGSAMLESQLLQANPKVALGLLGTGALAETIRQSRGAYMRSDFARNALTGAMTAPGRATVAAKPALTGAVNALNNQFREDK